jgi:hypothetical protein
MMDSYLAEPLAKFWANVLKQLRSLNLIYLFGFRADHRADAPETVQFPALLQLASGLERLTCTVMAGPGHIRLGPALSQVRDIYLIGDTLRVAVNVPESVQWRAVVLWGDTSLEVYEMLDSTLGASMLNYRFSAQEVCIGTINSCGQADPLPGWAGSFRRRFGNCNGCFRSRLPGSMTHVIRLQEGCSKVSLGMHRLCICGACIICLLYYRDWGIVSARQDNSLLGTIHHQFHCFHR